MLTRPRTTLELTEVNAAAGHAQHHAMLRAAAALAVLATASAMPASVAKGAGRWCAGKPLGDELSFTAASLAAARADRGIGDHAQFRGAFRDLSLWVEAAGTHDVRHCEVFDAHWVGNDGLWIIEYDGEKQMEDELLRMKELEVPV